MKASIDPNLAYRRLFETARDGIRILDFENGRITDVNPYLAELLGYPKDELIGKALWDIGAITDKNRAIKAYATLKKDGYIKYEDLPLRTHNGNLISVEFVSNAYNVNGNQVIQCNIRDITDRKVAEQKLIQYQQEYISGMLDIVAALTKAMASRDSYTYQHQLRVSHLCVAIAGELTLPLHTIEGLRLSALIHDIGKIAVPAEILTKPTQLEPYERQLMEHHVQVSYEIVKHIHFPWPIAQTVYQHHERLDGSGYPNHLKGDSIIEEARILAVADTVEAIAVNRPYRAALGLDTALRIIEDGRHKLYDTKVVDACLKLFRENHYQFPN